MRKLLLAIVAVCLFPAICFAGPFGTNMGDTVEKFNDVTKMDERTYATPKMPKEHSDFETYILDFASSGLYQIIAISKTRANDSYGIGSKALYSKLKEQLTEKYGHPLCGEELRKGALWKDEEDFVMSIYKNERIYGCEWSNSTMPDDLRQIRILISAESRSTSRVLLRYQYNNSIDAKKQKETSEKDSL